MSEQRSDSTINCSKWVFGKILPDEVQKSCYCEADSKREKESVQKKFKIGLVRQDDLCANELGQCACNGTVYYGDWDSISKNEKIHLDGEATRMKTKEVEGYVTCENAAFGGDPEPNVAKKCFCRWKPQI